jgi:UDPglucose 6-dehydrogenase/GDP-mannose 6-dehydrogenase
MIKYASNALQATAISFANEIANLCSAVGGIDALDVMAGVHAMKELNPKAGDGAHVRAGITSFLSPGCGFGGSCFPKDVKALVAHGTSVKTPMRLLEAVLRVNEDQPRKMIDLLRGQIETLESARVVVLGLAFKPGTDDMRESPAIAIVRDLIHQGAIVIAHDPIAIDEAKKVLSDEVQYVETLDEALAAKPDAVVIITRWDEYRRVPELMKRLPDIPVIDGRRMLERASVKRYVGIGLN